MNITMETLKQLLAEAYEAGWRGSLELRDEVARDLAERHEVESTSDPETFSFSSNVMITEGNQEWVITSDLERMNPDQIIQEFGLQDRPEITIRDVPAPGVDPADRGTWDIPEVE